MSDEHKNAITNAIYALKTSLEVHEAFDLEPQEIEVKKALAGLEALVEVVPNDLINRSKGCEIFTDNNGCGILMCDDESDIKTIFYTARLHHEAIEALTRAETPTNEECAEALKRLKYILKGDCHERDSLPLTVTGARLGSWIGKYGAILARPAIDWEGMKKDSVPKYSGDLVAEKNSLYNKAIDDIKKLMEGGE